MTPLHLPEGLELASDGALRVITLNRPEERNASTTEMLFAFPELFEALAADDEARVVILTGTGSAFSAGADFNFFARAVGFALENSVGK